MPIITRRTVHDVTAGSNLDLILRGSIGAVNRFSDALAGGLKAIAIALSTPQDNSEEVQKQIDHVEAQLKWQTDALQSAIDQTKGE